MARRLIARSRVQGECFVWTGNTNGVGYGLVPYRLGNRKQHLVHRIAYRIFVGPIPKGLVIDHLCRNTLCWRPSHLEPVTNAINIKRGWAVVRQACKKGHQDWGQDARGSRYCRECDRARHRKG